jgi:hypothetical protein
MKIITTYCTTESPSKFYNQNNSRRERELATNEQRKVFTTLPLSVQHPHPLWAPQSCPRGGGDVALVEENMQGTEAKLLVRSPARIRQWEGEGKSNMAVARSVLDLQQVWEDIRSNGIA